MEAAMLCRFRSTGATNIQAPFPSNSDFAINLITLPHGVIDRLKALRGAGESYSDVIIRVGEG
jgi:hypothetical protein